LHIASRRTRQTWLAATAAGQKQLDKPGIIQAPKKRQSANDRATGDAFINKDHFDIVFTCVGSENHTV
jgi:hypothetical protein